MASDILDFGEINLGDYRDLVFVFYQGVSKTSNGTPTNPGAGAFLNMTPPGGTKTPYSLVPGGGGQYTYGFTASIPGDWDGTAYAPVGSGQATLKFKITVLDDPNYG